MQIRIVPHLLLSEFILHIHFPFHLVMDYWFFWSILGAGFPDFSILSIFPFDEQGNAWSTIIILFPLMSMNWKIIVWCLIEHHHRACSILGYFFPMWNINASKILWSDLIIVLIPNRFFFFLLIYSAELHCGYSHQLLKGLIIALFFLCKGNLLNMALISFP